MNHKAELRKLFLQKRKLLTKEEIELCSDSMCQDFISNLYDKILNDNQLIIGGYLPIDNEVDITQIMSFLQTNGFTLALPYVTERNRPLEFYKWQSGNKLEYSIVYKKVLEPYNRSVRLIPDVIFVPLIAFDEKLYRLGYGGGFYDRTIKEIRKIKPNLITIGCGYIWQKVDCVNPDEYDEKLNLVIY